jgi:hypothetical protein
MRIFAIVLASGASLLGLFIWLATQTEFVYQHPKAKGVKVVVDRGGARVINPTAIAATSMADPASEARIKIPQAEYHFGYMDPLQKGSHRFEIRNEGNAPLELEVLSTTCTCTVAGAIDNLIAPGQAGSATLRSNAPNKRKFQLTVRGNIRVTAAADVETVQLPNLKPDQPSSASFYVYSQTWAGLEVIALDADIPGLKWEATQADPAVAPSLEATALTKVTVTVPGDLPQGELEKTLRVSVVQGRGYTDSSADDSGSKASAETEREEAISEAGSTHITLEIPLRARMLRRLAIYGPAIDNTGVLTLGLVEKGTEKRVKLLLKVRDADQSLALTSVETTPEFLKVAITPHREPGNESPTPGLYDMIVTVPADAPPCNYLGDVMGQLRIITKHPRIPETALGVRLGVIGE